MIEVNPEAERHLRVLAARVLLRMATVIQANEKAEWRSYPPASTPGEHLRGRTWWARDNLVYTPESVDEVADTLTVRIGYRRNAKFDYPSYWELFAKKKRIGLRHKFNQMRNSLGNIMGEFVT